MLRHRFKPLLAKEDQLPQLTLRYSEIEAAKLHGGWEAWTRLGPRMRGELLAHEIEKSLRETYTSEKMTATTDKTKPADSPVDRIRNRFFAPKGAAN